MKIIKFSRNKNVLRYNKNETGAGIVVQCVMPQLGMPASLIGKRVPSQPPCVKHSAKASWEAADDGSSVWTLPLSWETWVEFWDPGVSTA